MLFTETFQPVVSETLASHVDEAAELAYRKIVAEPDSHYQYESVHRRGVCDNASRLIMHHLAELGYPALQEIRTNEHGMHSYVLAYEEGTEIVADATWQQFASHYPGRDMPKVLIGTRSYVANQALRHGVHPAYIDYYTGEKIRRVIIPLEGGLKKINNSNQERNWSTVDQQR